MNEFLRMVLPEMKDEDWAECERIVASYDRGHWGASGVVAGCLVGEWTHAAQGKGPMKRYYYEIETVELSDLESRLQYPTGGARLVSAQYLVQTGKYVLIWEYRS